MHSGEDGSLVLLITEAVNINVVLVHTNFKITIVIFNTSCCVC